MRGEIVNRERAKQLRDFSGLRFGNITPTDIDGAIEYRNKAYIIMEAKYKDAPLPQGQRIALERLCDDLQKIKPTMLLICSHDLPPEYDIDMANTVVVEYRYRGETSPTIKEVTAREVVEWFIDKVDRRSTTP